MKHIFFIVLAGLGLLITACGGNDQRGEVIGLPTVVNEGGDGVIVVPTQVIVDGGDEQGSESPRPETVSPVPTSEVVTVEPAATATVVTAAVCQVRTDWIAYTVDTGDTLGRIAERTDSTVAELAEANCLNDVNRLDVGDVIYVPNTVVVENPADDFVRIRFPTGGEQAIVADELAAGDAHDYLFAAEAGQLLTVGFSETNGARVWVESSNGEKLAQGIGDFASYVLPETGDYLVKVTSEAAVAYELFIDIPASPQAADPERVLFESGSISGTVSGNSGSQIPQYVLGAGEGQQMTLGFDGPLFKVAVRGIDGQRVWEFDDAQIYPSYGPMTLPATQDYVISLLSVDDEDVAYELTVTIE